MNRRGMRFVILFVLLSMICTGCADKKTTEQISSLEADVSSLSAVQESQSSANESLKSDNESLESDKENLKTSLAKMESKFNTAVNHNKTLQSQIDEEKEETSVQTDDVTVVMTSKEQIPIDYSKQNYSLKVGFKFSVTNNTGKDIQGVQGIVYIDDLFGEKIVDLGCDFTGQTIPAGQTVEYNNKGRDINQFMEQDQKLYTTDYKDMKSTYKVTQIVFTDGTVKK